MDRVSIRELRNRGGAVIDRVQAGEHVVVTRSGRPVAELRPLRRSGPDPATLLERWRRLPPVEIESLRRDLDETIDASL